MAFRDQSDEALVHRVRSGEREVFGVLVDRYKRGIANFIGATVRNSSETADLSQETFLRAYAHLGTFNPQLGKFSTWIYQIARNVIRTLSRQVAARPAAARALAGAHARERASRSRRAQADPAGGVLREEAERELRAALAELPERTRTVLALRYFDNMEYQTIASTLGLSLGNVKTLIHRGKIALTKKMRERERRAIEALPYRAAEGRLRMRCSSCEPLLDAYLEATPRAAARRAGRAHLRACGGCAALLARAARRSTRC